MGKNITLRELRKFGFVEMGVKLANRFVRNLFYPQGDVYKFRRQYGNVDVYQTIWHYEEPEPDSRYIGDFYLDIDNHDLKEAQADAIEATEYLEEIGVTACHINVFFTGSKGFNVTVPWQLYLDYYEPELNRIWRLIAKDIYDRHQIDSIDLKVYDKRRLIRLANSIHSSTGLYKIPLTLDELYNYSILRIEEMAECKRVLYKTSGPVLIPKLREFFEDTRQIIAKRAERYPQTKQFPVRPFPGSDLPCIKCLLAGVEEGMRNGAAFTLTCYFKNKGDCEKNVVERLSSWNETNLPPLEPSEIFSIVKSVFENEYKIGCSSPILEEFCEEEQCPIAAKH
jgi:hypothetical protein